MAASEQWLNWVVRVDGAAVGYVQATVHDGIRAAVAWVIGAQCQGHGYATAAGRAMAGVRDALEYGATAQAAVQRRDGRVARRSRNPEPGLPESEHLDPGDGLRPPTGAGLDSRRRLQVRQRLAEPV